MGLEWHNRRRKANGQFMTRLDEAITPPEVAQIHIRVPWDDYRRIRSAANDAHEELAEFIMRACSLRIVAISGAPRRKPKTVKS